MNQLKKLDTTKRDSKIKRSLETDSSDSDSDSDLLYQI
jgi:hypothetical protein